MTVTFSRSFDPSQSDYIFTLLQFAGFVPFTEELREQVFVSQFDLSQQTTAHTSQQHLSLAMVLLFVMEQGINCTIEADLNEQRHIRSAMETHCYVCTLFGVSPTVNAMKLICG